MCLDCPMTNCPITNCLVTTWRVNLWKKKEFFKPITIELIVVFMINMYIWHRVQFLSYPL